MSTSTSSGWQCESGERRTSRGLQVGEMVVLDLSTLATVRTRLYGIKQLCREADSEETFWLPNSFSRYIQSLKEEGRGFAVLARKAERKYVWSIFSNIGEAAGFAAQQQEFTLV